MKHPEFLMSNVCCILFFSKISFYFHTTKREKFHETALAIWRSQKLEVAEKRFFFFKGVIMLQARFANKNFRKTGRVLCVFDIGITLHGYTLVYIIIRM